ncbi:MAG: 6-bladed beta-propeller [Rhodoferax sp.]|nr:6-bladed beta-propeller [Rhodoferax sp.]
MRGSRWLIWLVLALALGGCAEVKYTLHLDPDFRTPKAEKIWPAAPEQARYRYVGQLLGQDNLVAEAANQRNMGIKIFHWLVGLFDDTEEKITLKRPQTGTVDAQGRVYVTDISNHAVFVFDQAAGKLLVWEMAQETRRFVTPIGIAVGAGGQILVADAELGQVFQLDRDGKPIGSFGKGLLNRPTGLARDAARGRIYVADTHAHDIKVFDDAGVLLEVMAQRGDGENELNFPTHLAFGGDRLYVADTMNARVQIFDADGKSVGMLGKRGLYFGNLTRPKGVTVDSSDNVYVIESYYDNLLVFNKQGEFLLPIGGAGQQVGQFYLPAGLWSDSRGRIYVADMFNGRVVIFQFLGGS